MRHIVMKLGWMHPVHRLPLWCGVMLAAVLAGSLAVAQGTVNPPPGCNPLRPGGNLPVQQIESIMQTKGMVVNGVLLLTLGRKDLSVKGPSGHVFETAFAPNHKFFFQSLENGEAFMNAEFTFIPSEREATMNAIMSTPLELMAEHQHYIGENPQTFHYHFRGRGKATDVANWAMKVVRATGTPLPQPVPPNPTTPLPVAEIEQIIGGKATVMPGGVVMVMVTRPETFVEAGVVLKPQMNVLHKIAFEPLNANGTMANVGADFALVGGEVNPALKRAWQEGFAIHCLYNQQTVMDPQLFFSHTLKAGEPRALARSVRNILDVIAAVPLANPYCPQPTQ